MIEFLYLMTFFFKDGEFPWLTIEDCNLHHNPNRSGMELVPETANGVKQCFYAVNEDYAVAVVRNSPTYIDPKCVKNMVTCYIFKREDFNIEKLKSSFNYLKNSVGKTCCLWMNYCDVYMPQLFVDCVSFYEKYHTKQIRK